MRWLRSKGWSQSFSLTTVILFVLLIGGATITVLGAQLKQFAEDVPAYRDRFNNKLAQYNIDLGDAVPFFDEKKEGNTSDKQKKEETDDPALERRVRAEVDRALSEKSKEERRGAEARENARGIGAGELRTPRIAQVAYRTQEEAPFVSDWSDLAAGDEAQARDSDSVETAASVEETSVDELSAGEAENIEANDETLIASDEEEANEEPFQELDATPSVGVEAASNELFGYVLRLTNELLTFASSSFIVTLLVIFMLCETTAMPKKMAAALGKRSFVNEHIQRVVADIRNYMVIKTWMSLGVGTCVTLLLLVSNVQYPLLWGFVAFLLNYIPNIGSVVAAIPPIILASVEQSLVVGAVDAVFFVIINCTIGYAIEPRLLGNGLDLSPLIVLLALIIFGWLLGPIGMFLSPPLAVIIKIIFQSFPETRWIAVLMANRPPKDDGDSDDGAKVKARA
ncbi:MAG: AI-2E family transporter [Thermoguttaceae bacterium]|nr:AI-2E family transporter [Thermoguttaceae bacterium]